VIFIFSTTSIPAVGPSFPRIKRPERCVRHKTVGAVPLLHLYAFRCGLGRIFMFYGKGEVRCDVGIDRRVMVKLT
jgi:hypothetical protein